MSALRRTLKKRALPVAISAACAAMLSPATVNAVPAVFFDSDLDAGRQNFTSVVADASTSGLTGEIFELNLSSATDTAGVYEVQGDQGTTVYVKLAIGDRSVSSGNFSIAGGVAFHSVGVSNSGIDGWNEIVDEGFHVEVFNDAATSDAAQINAVGVEVWDWGTCCTGGNLDSSGQVQSGTAVYAVFDADQDPNGDDNSINLIGSIGSRSERGDFAGALADGGVNTNSHFVAAINDTALFNTVTVAPNGNGEGFGFGGILYFGQVDIDSVPAGSSVIGVGKRDISGDELDSAVGGSLNAVFNGGTLTASANQSASFTIRNSGGAIRIQDGGSVEFTGVLADQSGEIGSLEKVGDGTLTLSGTNTYSGGTRVSAGVLQVSADGNLGDSGGAVSLNGGALEAATSFSTSRLMRVESGNGELRTGAGVTLTMAGDIEGSGALSKTGAGTLVITVDGDHLLTGQLTVSDGVLQLDGTLDNDIVAATGSTVKGSGSAGNLQVAGTLAPGNSPGTLTSTGDVTLVDGATFEVEIDGDQYDAAGGAGSYDRVVLTDASSTFTAAGTLVPVLRGITGAANNDFTPELGDQFRIVETANPTGIAGEFAGITDPAAGMAANTRFDLIYGDNALDLVVTPDSFASFAGVQNAVNAAQALDTIRPDQGARLSGDSGDLFAGLYGLDSTSLDRALLQTSGEIHAFAMNDLRDGARNAATAMMDALYRAPAGDQFWVDVSGYGMKYKQDSQTSSYDSQQRHLWIGQDLYVDEGRRAGLALGHFKSDIDTDNSGSAEQNTTALAAYYLMRSGGFDAEALLGAGVSQMDTERRVQLSGGNVSLTAENDSAVVFGSLGGGYRYAFNDVLTGRSWLRMNVEHLRSDAYQEQGDASVALSATEESWTSSQVAVGYSLFYALSGQSGTAYLDMGASKQLGGEDKSLFRDVGLHDVNWRVDAPATRAYAGFASAGVAMKPAEDVTVDLGISGSAAEDRTAFGAHARVNLVW